MTRKELVLIKHREAIRAAAARHRCRSIALVGSVARGEDSQESDYDFLADFEKGVTLFDQCGLQAALEDLLGSEVDVVPRSSIRESYQNMYDDAIKL
ncbi:MAG: nucleotidyltransferase domain-containing protein [Acidimicrobiaceae bacterium]|nr:nucleotidyltransferase domain-containing protein [Acidimicrobiaceae bacterium]